MEKATLKSKLLSYSKQLIQDRIAEAEIAHEATRESRDSDTKSTAGDKHEVGRAMIQIELDNQAAQLSKNKVLLEQLKLVRLDRSLEEVGFGSLVEMNTGTYFISIGLGRIEYEGVTYFIISRESPIGQAMDSKKRGDTFEFNGNSFEIKNIS